ncbi:MAG: TPM domain-containing protein [Miniphocaeibacter sp.]|uniref:TPM domain-containing protein n=1 Tax=Miniphocaeibacter sp. TaxID=3100973 RepID=UPI0017F220C5|nr:TPM domain-containing protein [Gallicola sp.]
MKKKLVILVTLLTIFISNVSFAIPNPTSDFYVYDEMNVISNSTKEHIMNTNIEIEGKTKAQIVVATINDLEGIPREDYALQMYRKFGIGDKEENNGVLILLGYEPLDDKYQVRIEVGYGLEGILNDAKVGRIIDEYMLPYFDRDNKSTFDEGLKEGFNAVVSQVIQEYNIEIEGNYSDYVEDLEKTSEDNFSVGKIIGIIIVIIVISSIFGSNNFNGPSSGSRRRYYRGGYYGGFGGFGGSGGRGTGGGFSGGGGSSGGGGAGRSF